MEYEQPAVKDRSRIDKPHPLHQAAFNQEEPPLPPKPVVVSPFQKEIIDYMLSIPDRVSSSATIGQWLGRRSQAIGASLQHLEKAGVARFLEKGMWEILPAASNVIVGKPDGRGKAKKSTKVEKKAPPVEQPTVDPQPGDLFELVGKTKSGATVVRSVESHIVYALVEVLYG